MRLFQKIYGPAGQKQLLILNRWHWTYRGSRISNHGLRNRFVNVPYHCEIYCHGDDCIVEFGQGIDYFKGQIIIGDPTHKANGCKVIVGNACFSMGLNIRVHEDGCVVKVGDDCLFSEEVFIWASDMHALLVEGVAANASHGVTIGDRVWVGHRASILKNVTIPSGCVVGGGSVVSLKDNVDVGCIYAGNPARIIKRGIDWNVLPVHKYLSCLG